MSEFLMLLFWLSLILAACFVVSTSERHDDDE